MVDVILPAVWSSPAFPPIAQGQKVMFVYSSVLLCLRVDSEHSTEQPTIERLTYPSGSSLG